MAQIKGQLYYEGVHDILTRKRTMIGEMEKLQTVENLPNNRIVDNQYAELVQQKTNYIVDQPVAPSCENKAYVDAFNQVFNRRFMRTLKNAVKVSLNQGIAWLYVYYDDGQLSFRLFPGYEILPFWRDREHAILDSAVRLYAVTEYEGRTPIVVQKVELYELSGVRRFVWDGARLTPEADRAFYLTDGAVGYNWERIPLVPIKYNEPFQPRRAYRLRVGTAIRHLLQIRIASICEIELISHRLLSPVLPFVSLIFMGTIFICLGVTILHRQQFLTCMLQRLFQRLHGQTVLKKSLPNAVIITRKRQRRLVFIRGDHDIDHSRDLFAGSCPNRNLLLIIIKWKTFIVI